MNSSKKTIAVYAGTFDPFTNGHLDVAERAATLFDTVHIAVSKSTGKKPLFDEKERIALIEEAIGENHNCFKVESFDGLLVDYLEQCGASVIIRGLRAVSDYEFEYEIAMMNRHLRPNVETVFLMASQKYSFVSSSMVKEVARFGGDVSSLVPTNVAKKLGTRSL